jgi:uncharacterized protein
VKKQADTATAVVETHASTVLFLGDRAYKIKRPVDLGFLDFTTLDARRRACHAEVELNRRLAPDVYLGVADVVGPDRQPCEHMVVMRRMPAGRRLSTLITDGEDVDDEIRAVARAMASFHAAARRSGCIALAGLPERVLANWEQSFEQMRRFVGAVLDPAACARIEDGVRRYLAGRLLLLERRMDDGEIVDGHGDLQADDIFCLDDGPRILDCLDFSADLRHGDVVADIGFLAMDLERLGRADLAERFMGWYREFSAEWFPYSLAHHYVAYRAHVRSKVACLRDDVDEARRLLELARRHVDASRISLIVVGGLPGSGKSTVAAGVGERLGLPVLRSDEIRKELAGIPPLEPAGAPYGEGIYAGQSTDSTYSVMLDRATEALRLGQSVVLDASFTDQRWRDAAWLAAEATKSDLLAVRCAVPAGVAEARLRSRARGTDPSDATPEILRRMTVDADSWPEAATVMTAGAPSAAVDQVVTLLREVTSGPGGTAASGAR